MPKAQAAEARVKKCTTSNCKASQGTGSKQKKIKIKKQPMDWEKIFENHIFDKGLKFKIYKELIQLKSKTVK